MKRRTRIGAMILAIVMVATLAVSAIAGHYYPIYINGVKSDVKGDTVNGVTTVGLRALAEKLGFNVDFDYKTNTIQIEEKNQLKLTTLAENNNGENTDLTKEFGFSVLIETKNDKILFDTAKAGMFMENAAKMNLDVADVNKIVLSHTHYDHCGGLLPYFDKYGAQDKTLFIKNTFFDYADERYYHDTVGKKFDFSDGTIGYFPVGIDFTEEDLLKRNVAIEYLDTNAIKIADGVTMYGRFDQNPEFALAPSMVEKLEDGTYRYDNFDEEVALAIETTKGLVIVSGCSHTGILNIVNNIEARSGQKVYAVIGGFHLLDATEADIQKTIDRFKTLGIEHIGLSHCTGPLATQMFREQMPEATFINATGSVYEVK